MKKNRLVIINIETTGINSDADEILRLTAINEYGTILLSQMFHPVHTKSWVPASMVHHIVPEAVEECPTLIECRNEIEEVMYSAEYLIGCNTEFMIRIMQQAGIRTCQQTFPCVIDIIDEINAHISSWHAPIYTLRECAEYLQYAWSEKQNAGIDACMTILLCYRRLFHENVWLYTPAQEDRRGEGSTMRHL